MRFAVLSLVAALGAASPAAAWLSPNNQVVQSTGEGRFEVRARPGLSASQAFCAAGEYASRILGVPQNARIWRASPPPRRRGEGISFSLTDPGIGGKTGLLMFGNDTGSVSVAVATQLCWGNDRLW